MLRTVFRAAVAGASAIVLLGPGARADEPDAGRVSWSGFYVGATAGYGWSDDSASLSALSSIFVDPAIPASIDADSRGWLWGAYAGYNHQRGNLVFGFEGDISHSDISGSGSITINQPFPFITGTTDHEQDLKWFGTLRARVGILPTPRLLVYATGGLAFGAGSASTTTTASFPGIPNACATNFFCTAGSSGKSEALVGWTAGGGLEYRIASNWTTKLEYLYYDLGSISYTLYTTAPVFPTTPALQPDAEFRGSIVRLGLSYKFD